MNDYSFAQNGGISELRREGFKPCQQEPSIELPRWKVKLETLVTALLWPSLSTIRPFMTTLKFSLMPREQFADLSLYTKKTPITRTWSSSSPYFTTVNPATRQHSAAATLLQPQGLGGSRSINWKITPSIEPSVISAKPFATKL